LEALNYIDVLADDPSRKVLCVLTEEGRESPWVGRLPGSVAVMKFGEETAGFTPPERSQLLARLVIQETPLMVHNLNSPVAYDMFIEYGKAVSQSTRIFNSIFCTEFDADGAQTGYAVDQLDKCYDVITKVFSDNNWFIGHLIDIYDFDRDRFAAHNMPPDKTLKALSREARRKPGDAMNALWASRLDRQKRIDVLAKIVKRCENLPIEFHVYGGSLNPVDDAIVNEIRSAPNVKFAGPYDGFASLPVTDMDVYLYTTSWDGTPNVILEATMSGLPIVAPPVGGIPEVLGGGAGLLVSDPDDVEGFVGALKQLLESPELGAAIVQKAQDVVATRHSWESFRAAVLSETGYCK
jgi:glycosyltransferase involved in cell wall biosynthesis